MRFARPFVSSFACILAFVCSPPAQAQSNGGACVLANESTPFGAISSMQYLSCIGSVWTLQPVQVGAATASCASGTAGQIQWTGSLLQYCNGSSWTTVGTSSSSGITLGPSASATNPQVSGDATTGFYTAGSGKVDVAASGTQIAEFLSTGENIVTGSLKLAGVNGLWQDNANFNMAVGSTALPSTISQAGSAPNGQYITAVGYQALNANTTGYKNTAVGNFALNANTTGIQNSALGSNALQSNTTGSYNTAIGAYALPSNMTGIWNTALGDSALYTNSTGIQNVAVGGGALFSNTTGTWNVGVGNNALWNNSTGQYNTAIGNNALDSNTAGSNNTALGYQVGSTTLSTGSNNILIGTSSAVDTAAAGANYNLNIGNLLQGDMTSSTALGTEALYLQSTSGSVDYVQIAGGASGSPGAVTISGQGSDSNVNIALLPKGIGGVGIGTTSPQTTLDVNAGSFSATGPVATHQLGSWVSAWWTSGPKWRCGPGIVQLWKTRKNCG